MKGAIMVILVWAADCLGDNFWGNFGIKYGEKHRRKRRRGPRLIGHKSQPIPQRVFHRTCNK